MNSETALSRKQLTVFATNNESWVFKQELEFWKTHICNHELGSFVTFQVFFDDIHRDVNDCDFLILYNKRWHLENVCNLVNQYFPNDQNMMWPYHAWINDPWFKLDPIDFQSNYNSTWLWKVFPLTSSLFNIFQQDGLLMLCFVLVNRPVGSAPATSSSWRTVLHSILLTSFKPLYKCLLHKETISESQNQSRFLPYLQFSSLYL